MFHGFFAEQKLLAIINNLDMDGHVVREFTEEKGKEELHAFSITNPPGNYSEVLGEIVPH
jgi:hypothetical protein